MRFPHVVVLAIGTLTLGVAADAAAQDVNPAVGSATIEDLAQIVDGQRRIIETQGQHIEQLQQQLDALRGVVTALPAAPVAPAVEPLSAERRNDWPEIPPDLVSAGDFPGSFKIPGSDAAIKVGGMVRVNWVTTYQPLLVTDRFITSDIPVGVPNAPVGGSVAVMAIPSRFNLDVRTPTGVGYMRAFIEGDFAGSGNTLRMRHAYGQWKRFLFGQTWSTFSDPEAEPDGIDFEGLNAMVHFRQPQIRWSWAPAERLRVAMALENADTEITGATAANRRPDVIARLRWDPGRGGHVQASGLFRQLRGYPPDTAADVVGGTGWGFNASGRLPSPFRSERDLLVFQVNRGSGIGHYITDLSSEGGQDGVFDAASNTVQVLRAFSAYGSYEHWWSEPLHSAFTAGVVDVTNVAIQSATDLHLTQRYSTNIIWSPIPRLELVAEFLYGVRVNKNLDRESAAQMQIGTTFRF